MQWWHATALVALNWGDNSTLNGDRMMTTSQCIPKNPDPLQPHHPIQLFAQATQFVPAFFRRGRAVFLVFVERRDSRTIMRKLMARLRRTVWLQDEVCVACGQI